MNGRCTCGQVAYRLTDTPMFVHCCHCTWCQRETGTAFALNAMIEGSCVEITRGTPEDVMLPSDSGQGQNVTRCPACRVALWSTYSSPAIRFVRVGTLEDPAACPPDVHIYTSTKLPWVVFPEGARVFEEYYDRETEWPEATRARRRRALEAG